VKPDHRELRGSNDVRPCERDVTLDERRSRVSGRGQREKKRDGDAEELHRRRTR
jgi:hypothetical protein